MKIILALMATLTAIYVVSLPAQEITNPADTYVF